MLYPTVSQTISQISGLEPKTGDVGVELEIEGLNLPRVVAGWMTKHEGSLRGRNGRQVPQGDNSPDAPFEYVTPRPVGLPLLNKKLNQLHHALTSNGSQVQLTSRASTHIHVNMLSHDVRSLLGYMVIYAIIEPVLLRLCGPVRNGNLFCLPSYETGDLPLQAAKISAALQANARHNWPVKRGKYAALNLDPLFTYGSVELRCFPNCIEPDVIHKWATWVLNIRELAASYDDPTYMSLIDKTWKTPTWLTQNIFGAEPLATQTYPNTLHELMTFGVEQGYEIAQSAQSVLNFQPSAKPQKSKRLVDEMPEIVFDDGQTYDDLDILEGRR